jgi:hypothetical protein
MRHNPGVLTNDSKAFIRNSIKSVWGLELLLFLRAHTDQSWTVASLTRELRASEFIVRGCLALFRTADLIHEDADGNVKFAPASAKLESMVGEVANAYAINSQAIADEIYAPDSRIRHFADAFRLKKEP